MTGSFFLLFGSFLTVNTHFCSSCLGLFLYLLDNEMQSWQRNDMGSSDLTPANLSMFQSPGVEQPGLVEPQTALAADPFCDAPEIKESFSGLCMSSSKVFIASNFLYSISFCLKWLWWRLETWLGGRALSHSAHCPGSVFSDTPQGTWR